jgi:hypothetical protein
LTIAPLNVAPPDVSTSVIHGGERFCITRLTARLPIQLFTSVAFIVIGKSPCCVGVPESVAVIALNVIPEGSAPVCEKVYGPVPPDPEKVVLVKGVFTVPVGTGFGLGVTLTVHAPASASEHPPPATATLRLKAPAFAANAPDTTIVNRPGPRVLVRPDRLPLVPHAPRPPLDVSPCWSLSATRFVHGLAGLKAPDVPVPAVNDPPER